MNPQSDGPHLAGHIVADAEIAFRSSLFRFGGAQRQRRVAQFRRHLLCRRHVGPAHLPCARRDGSRILHRIQQQPLPTGRGSGDRAVLAESRLPHHRPFRQTAAPRPPASCQFRVLSSRSCNSFGHSVYEPRSVARLLLFGCHGYDLVGLHTSLLDDCLRRIALHCEINGLVLATASSDKRWWTGLGTF